MNKGSLPNLRKKRQLSELEHIYEELKHLFIAGEFAPGQRLTFPLLAEAFGTSQMPIREAVNRLVVARALESPPRRSPVVPKATIDKLDSLLPLRLLLEGEATRLATINGRENLVAELENINARMDVEAETGDSKKYLQLNQRFHFALYKRSKNDELVDMIELLWMRYGPLMSLVRSGVLSITGHGDHSAVIEGIRARDPEMAAEAIKRDLTNAAAAIRKAIVDTEAQEAADNARGKGRAARP